jgi:ubiquinone/menaquinone biosynthesis C-methylase UbiE
MLWRRDEEAMPADKDARFWDRIARKYAADPIRDMPGYERTIERTRHYLQPTDTVLEIGCGTGTTALKLAPSVEHYVASDVSSEMIAIGREKAAAAGCANITFEVSVPNASPWPDATFNAALAFNVLHLIAERSEALAGVHRQLKPRGLFISKTPCLKEMSPLIRLFVPLAQAMGQAPYVAFLSDEELERDIVAAGFEIVERERHGSRSQDPRPFFVARRA